MSIEDFALLTEEDIKSDEIAFDIESVLEVNSAAAAGLGAAGGAAAGAGAANL